MRREDNSEALHGFYKATPGAGVAPKSNAERQAAYRRRMKAAGPHYAAKEAERKRLARAATKPVTPGGAG
jgi:hypothetical protein